MFTSELIRVIPTRSAETATKIDDSHAMEEAFFSIKKRTSFSEPLEKALSDSRRLKGGSVSRSRMGGTPPGFEVTPSKSCVRFRLRFRRLRRSSFSDDDCDDDDL